MINKQGTSAYEPKAENSSTSPVSSLERGGEPQMDSPASPGRCLGTDYIFLTPYPVEPYHDLITIVRINKADFKPEMLANAAYQADAHLKGIVINKRANIMDYNRLQASQKERLQPPSAKMSFKVFLINSVTNRQTLEQRTLRFWLNQQLSQTNNIASPTTTAANHQSSTHDERQLSQRTYANMKQDSSRLARAYFRNLIGSKPNDFPKDYVSFLMRLMYLLKMNQFAAIVRMEVEIRQLAQEDLTKPPSRASSIDGANSGQSADGPNGRGSPLTSQKILDIIESSYPNPISIREICSSAQSDETSVRQLVDELTDKEKVNSTDDGQHFTRTIKQIDTKINLVKQMPKVIKSQQPVIAILTSQYCEKLAVDSMISDKETFVRYRTTTSTSGDEFSSANYVYTLGNIGDLRVVSTKLTSIGHSRGALISAGSATTRLLGTFPELEYVFLVGCGGGIVDYTDFGSHVRLGDVVVSHLPNQEKLPSSSSSSSSTSSSSSPSSSSCNGTSGKSMEDYMYIHCREKQQQDAIKSAQSSAGLPVSYSIHRNLKSTASGEFKFPQSSSMSIEEEDEYELGGEEGAPPDRPIKYHDCHFRLWRPARLDLQNLGKSLWLRGLDNPTHRIWEYYIDEGIKILKQQDIDATRPPASTDKLFMSIGSKDTIEVNHPEPGEGEVDLRRDGRPMCHFGPLGSGRPAATNETIRQQMVSEFGLKAFDSEFDAVVESIYGNCKECYIMIRGISDYTDGRKKKEWQQYSALVAAAFMKSIIVNLKPLN